MKKKVFFPILIFVAIICLCIGWFSQKHFTPIFKVPVPIRQDSTEYKLVNPLLFLRTSKTFYAQEFEPLNKLLNTEINKDISSNKATSVSIYYNNLNNGHWTGINEDLTYDPSSMMKVPEMIATLKLATEDPSLLSKQLVYKGIGDADQNYPPEQSLNIGSPYSVQDLIHSMIVYSDNGAADALFADTKIQAEFQATYNTFRLPNIPSAANDYMSPRSYSAIFRTLYNGTYFSPSLDEQILELLTKTTFTQGIVAGVPKDTVVAHKFGERIFKLTDGTIKEKELHDCGIVYIPSNPYLVCIMTKGTDFPDLESTISGLSKIVYDSVK